jgi:hypothetical protein
MKNKVLDMRKLQKIQNSSNVNNPNRTLHMILGGLCLFWGLTASKGGRLRTLAGTSLIACGVMDIDPMKASSEVINKVGTKDNLFNIVKSFMPGQGMNPRDTDQASPQKRENSKNSVDVRSLKEMLTLG